MKRTGIKRMGALLLAGCLLTGMLPIMPGMSKEVHAADATKPDVTKFATKEELTTNFGLDIGDTIARIKFGADKREWLIAGEDTDRSLALLSTADYGKSLYGNNSRYSDSTIVQEFLPNLLTGTTYFSGSEQAKMRETTVSTEDWEGTSSDVSRKLYLPDAKRGRSGYGDTEIRVGANNNIPVALANLTTKNGFSDAMGGFWLRSPNDASDNTALVGQPGGLVNSAYVGYQHPVVSAFDLDLSSVLFASAAPAASSEGKLTENKAFTLRHTPDNELGKAYTATMQDAVYVRGVADTGDVYLVAQNAEGSWAKKVVEDATITPDQMGEDFPSFAGCKVWLEQTDAAERITTATMAVTASKVTVTAGLNMTKTTDSGAEVQTDVAGAMQDIIYTANKGYYFPEDYTTNLSMDENGIQVTRDSFTQITVSGTPTADATVQLADATEKAIQEAPAGVADGVEKITGTTSAMEYAPKDTSETDVAKWTACGDSETAVPAGNWWVRYKETDTQKVSPVTEVTVTPVRYSITADVENLDFGETDPGYTVDAMKPQTVTITNNGNVNVTLTQPEAHSYTIGALSTDALAPNEMANFTVQPNADLPAGDYQETIQVTTEQGAAANIPVTFHVNSDLSVTIDPDHAETVAGEPLTLTAIPDGGSEEYTYAWYEGAAADPFSTEAQVTVNPEVTTTYKVVVNDTIEDVQSVATITVHAKTFEITANPTDIDFGTADEGYQTSPAARTVTVTNNGNSEVTLSKPISTEYEIGDLSADTLAPGASASFKVQPKTGLAAGTYNKEIAVATEQGTTATVKVTFTVNPALSVTVSPASSTITKGESQTLKANPKGGSGTYTYQWYAGNSKTAFANGQSAKVSPTVTTTYKVVVSDTKAKAEAAGTVTVKEPDKPTPDKPTPDKPTPDKPTPDKPTPDKPSPDKPAPKEMHFSDVSEQDWYYQYVKYVFENGYMTGLNDTYFGAVKPVSRAQFATILYRIEGKPQVSYQNIFPDVPKGTFYSDAVLWAQSAGIMKGYENGKFGASDDITREQLVTTLYRYTQYKGKNTKTSGDISGYPDVSRVSKFANDAMKWAVGESIIKGDGGKLNPQGKASRATTATIFQRYETNPEFK